MLRQHVTLFRPFRTGGVLWVATQGGVAALLDLGYILSRRWRVEWFYPGRCPALRVLRHVRRIQTPGRISAPGLHSN